ncbi:MAG: hypothetical protein WBZ36_29185 [Candidatus Nitrosopolaris sp.]
MQLQPLLIRLNYIRDIIIVIRMRSKKQESIPRPPGPKSPSQRLERYNCTLDKDFSERTRLLGLERKQSVCSLVNEAVDDFIRRKREPESS